MTRLTRVSRLRLSALIVVHLFGYLPLPISQWCHLCVNSNDEPDRRGSGEHGERADEQRQPAARSRPQGQGQAQKRWGNFFMIFFKSLDITKLPPSQGCEGI